jgi:hypothetical protein
VFVLVHSFEKKKTKKKKILVQSKEQSVEAIVRCVNAFDHRSPSEYAVHSV